MVSLANSIRMVFLCNDIGFGPELDSAARRAEKRHYTTVIPSGGEAEVECISSYEVGRSIYHDKALYYILGCAPWDEIHSLYARYDCYIQGYFGSAGAAPSGMSCFIVNYT